jgi:hypothetical protein
MAALFFIGSQIKFKKLLRAERTPGTKNAKTRQERRESRESRAPRPAENAIKGRQEGHEGAKKARTPDGGKPCGALLFFLKASNSSFLSQKLLDIWPKL